MEVEFIDIDECVDAIPQNYTSNNVSTQSTSRNVNFTGNHSKLKARLFVNMQNGFQCKTCKKVFSLKTSHSTLKKHYVNHENNKTARQSKRQVQYDRLILNFVVHGNHPFRVVEETHFKKMLQGLNSGYSPLSRTKLDLNIQELFQRKQGEVIEFIKTVTSKILLTFDFWTSITNKPYLVVTAHFIHNGKLQSFILDFDLIPYPHNSEQIMHKILEILNSFGLQKRIISITTDNENTNIKCLRLLTLYDNYEDIIHTRCIAHILNLAVKSGIKKVQDLVSAVSKLVNVINFSPKKKQKYLETCTKLGSAQLVLMKEMTIRWNSTFLMLERAEKMKDVLTDMCLNNNDLSDYYIDILMWDQIKLLIDFLKPFFDATLLLSKSKFPSIYYVIPILDIINKHLSDLETEETLLLNCAKEITDKLQEYFPLLRTEYAKFSVLLDPRLKQDYFIENPDNTDPLTTMKIHFNNKYKIPNQALERRSDPLDPSQMKNTLFSSIYKRRSINEDELNKYLSLPTEVEDTNVIDWWKNQSLNLPGLQKMAYDILCIPASSVPSEQAFSKSGNLITKKRNRLGNKTIRSSMCLSSWLNDFGD